MDVCALSVMAEDIVHYVQERVGTSLLHLVLIR